MTAPLTISFYRPFFEIISRIFVFFLFTNNLVQIEEGHYEKLEHRHGSFSKLKLIDEKTFAKEYWKRILLKRNDKFELHLVRRLDDSKEK